MCEGREEGGNCAETCIHQSSLGTVREGCSNSPFAILHCRHGTAETGLADRLTPCMPNKRIPAGMEVISIILIGAVSARAVRWITISLIMRAMR